MNALWSKSVKSEGYGRDKMPPESPVLFMKWLNKPFPEKPSAISRKGLSKTFSTYALSIRRHHNFFFRLFTLSFICHISDAFSSFFKFQGSILPLSIEYIPAQSYPYITKLFPRLRFLLKSFYCTCNLVKLPILANNVDKNI